MSTFPRLDAAELWHIAGWTMVHFLWLGALIGIAAAALRLVLRRDSPNARYVAAAASLALLAALPLAIAGWLAVNHPPFQGGARGGFLRAGENVGDAVTLTDTTEGTGSVVEFDVHSTELSRETVALQSNIDAIDGVAEPSHNLSLIERGAALALMESTIAYLPWIWLVGTPLTLLFLFTGIIGTERLRRASQPIATGPLIEACTRLARSLRVGRRVAIAVCDRVCAPVLVGILRPIILLPPAALAGWSPDEIEMVLLHELAHVRRWDNFVNLLQRLVESLLFFHPAVWLVSSWMRRDREACCDAIVVTCTRRPHAYAELLVALAAQMPRSVLFHPAASSAMAASPLRNRIRRILQLEDDSMLVTGKSFALMLAGLLTAATLAVLYLPTRGQAEESATGVTEDTETSEEKAESADAVESLSADELRTDSSAGETSDLVARSLKKLQAEIRQDWEDYLLIAEGGDSPQASERDTKTDLLINDVSSLRKQKSKLEKQLFQLRNDFLINKSRLDDPQLIDLHVEKALGEDAQYMLLKQQLMELQKSQMRMSSEAGSRRARGASAINQQISQVMVQIQNHRAAVRAQIERDRRTKPDLMLQQLQKEFQTNAQLAQMQLAGINKALEEAMTALSTRTKISIDLQQRDKELKQKQEIADDMIIKLGMLQGDEAPPSSAEVGGNAETGDEQEKSRGEAEEQTADDLQIDAPNGEAGISADNDIATAQTEPTGQDREPEPTADSDRNSNSAAADNEPIRRVEVEQLRVGDDDVMVVRGSQDNVNAFVNVMEGDKNREPQNERRVLGTFSPDPSGQQDILRAADEAREKNLYVDIVPSDGKWALVVAPEPTQADWPAMLGDPPRKERVIADKAWQRLGLKVAPASSLEKVDFHTRRHAGPVKILGGNVPKGLPLPAFLRRIGGNDLDSFDDLHIWLINDEDERPEPVKVYAFANGHEYLFEAGPVDEVKTDPAQQPVAKFPSLEDQKLADLAWQMIQLELEPAGKDELNHVRALGYQGGVTVIGTPRSDSRRTNYNEVQPGDILVGLHVWPTTSLKDVANILTRDDLAELNPLKFYVVRGGELVVTGRISVRSPGAQPSRLSQLNAAERSSQNSPVSAGDLSAYVRQSGDERPAASKNEIKVLDEHIKTLQSQFDRIDALFKSGDRGGSAENRALAAYELAAAQGELALAQGQHAKAIKRFNEAQSHAQDAYIAFTAAYDVGIAPYNVVVTAAKNLADIKRKIIQLEQQRTAPNRAAAARRGAASTTSSALPAGEAEKTPATSAAPDPKQPSSPNKRGEAGVTVSAESQEALDQFMRLASSTPRSGESIGVLKRIVNREKQKLEHMAQLAIQEKASAIEVETQKADYEISMERLRQAHRALEYYKAEVAMAAAEYEAALDASKQSPRSVSELELRKLQLKVQLAEAKLKELAE